MSRIASYTDLANLALSKIAARRINDIESDQTVEAQACALHLPQIVESLLRRYQWNFATRRGSLSQIAGFTSPEWTSAWQLPDDLVRLIRIPTSDPATPHRDFAIEGRHLLTNGLETCPIVYISRDVPLPQWDALFVDAAVQLLAAAISGDVTKNPQVMQSTLEMAERLSIPVAEIVDSREVSSGENSGVFDAAKRSALVGSRYRRSGVRGLDIYRVQINPSPMPPL